MALFDAAEFATKILHDFKHRFISLAHESRRFLQKKSKVTKSTCDQMQTCSTNCISIYYMEHWGMSISDFQLIQESIVYRQDLNETFDSSEKDASLTDLCNNNASDSVLPGHLQCTWCS